MRHSTVLYLEYVRHYLPGKTAINSSLYSRSAAHNSFEALARHGPLPVFLGKVGRAKVIKGFIGDKVLDALFGKLSVKLFGDAAVFACQFKLRQGYAGGPPARDFLATQFFFLGGGGGGGGGAAAPPGCV